MKQDMLVEEVRQVRRNIDAECGNDPRKYAERLHAVERAYASRLTRRQPVAALRVAEERVAYGEKEEHGAK